jgi:glycerol kinase
MKADSGIDIFELRVDGGASVSDIMMQIQADMIQAHVNRPKVVETTALGAAYCAGLAVGLWENIEEIKTIRKFDRIFSPEMSQEDRDKAYAGWKKAVERAQSWAKE